MAAPIPRGVAISMPTALMTRVPATMVGIENMSRRGNHPSAEELRRIDLDRERDRVPDQRKDDQDADHDRGDAPRR